MSYSNLKITEKCIKCGSCLGCGFEFLTSANDGSIVIKEGTTLNEDSAEFKSLKDICPMDAFEIIETKPLTKQDIVTESEKLKNYVVRYPDRNTFKFDKSEYDISIPVASGERKYEYSSDTAADRAAEREFNNKMYSQIDTIILKIITEYRVKYLKQFYSKTSEDNSFFLKCNNEVSELLCKIVSIIKNNDLSNDLPNDFTKINIFPENDIYWKMLSKGEIMSDEMISPIRNEFNSGSYSDLSSYNYWDTDSMERIVGTDRHGYTKTKEKYCYRNVHKAFLELKKDLLKACGYADDKIEERALKIVNALIDEYNKQLQSALASKLAYLNSKVDKIPVGDSIVKLEKYNNVIRIVEKNSDGIFVDGEKNNASPIEEIFITASDNAQFFFDGTVIKKKYISNDIIHSDVIYADKNFDYRYICGFNGNILFADYNKSRNLYCYNTNSNILQEVDSNLFRVYFRNDYCIYVTTHNIENYSRYSTHTIRCCKIDGSDKRSIWSSYSGAVFIKEITDTQIKYNTLQDSTEKTIDWNHNK